MRKLCRVSWAVAFVLLLAGSGVAGAAEKENGKQKRPGDELALERLRNAAGGQAEIRISRATGVPRFISVDPDASGDLMAAGGAEARTKSSVFLSEYAGVFGLRDARELVLGRDDVDELGARHMSYYQFHRGVPVFAGVLRTHFNASGRADHGQRRRDPGSGCRRGSVAGRDGSLRDGDPRGERRQRATARSSRAPGS